MPRWAAPLLRRLAEDGRAEDVTGDLEEAHSRRAARHGTLVAKLLTALETVEMGAAMVRVRFREGKRGRRAFAMSMLDLKLGLRLLRKYPGLTAVGGLAIAFGIAVGAATFEFATQLLNPRLPLPDGERIVAIRLHDAATGGVEARAAHDYVEWREQLSSVEMLGAFRTVERNVIVGEGVGQPATVAETTGSAFRLTRVPPHVGRTLTEADELTGAPDVVVLGYDVWQARFRGDAGVVGRTLFLGGTPATVVGVMPEGFAFPVAHELWTPLRLNVLAHARREGPALTVFGRLADGVTLGAAQAELNTVGARAAVAFPDTDRQLRPEVLPYARAIVEPPEIGSAGLFGVNVFMVMLLVLICGNVGLLMYARATTREGEIVVRTALGASRGRIVGQLVAEALVLGAAAAIVGLVTGSLALRWLIGVLEADDGAPLPFWFQDALSPATIGYSVLLTLIAALVAGGLPARKVTRGVGGRLKQLTAGGGGLRFSGVWTAVIIAQVAVTVTFPATAFFVRRSIVQVQSLDIGFAAGQYLSVRLEREEEGDATLRELRRRLDAEPGVLGVALADRLPRTYHPQERIELDGDGAVRADSVRGARVGVVAADDRWFDVVADGPLAGRGFRVADIAADPAVVLVDERFANTIFGGGNPIGRRIRFQRPPDVEPAPWREIVGVVPARGAYAADADPTDDAAVYLPLDATTASTLYMILHVGGDPSAFAPRLRAVAAAVDPSLRLHEMLPLDEVGASLWLESAFLFRLLLIVSAIAMLLSLSSIYAVMAFTVSRRTREIGIRVALGASTRSIVAAIFRHPLLQVGAGVAVGALLTTALSLGVLRGGFWPYGALLVVCYAAVMLGACLLACIVPARRALAVQPRVALAEEG